MTTQSILLIILLAVPGVVITIMVLVNFEKHIPDYLENDLLRNFSEQVGPEIINKRIDFSNLNTLPRPVEGYLRHVLTEGQPLISIVKINQTGELSTNTQSNKWYAFTAKQLVTPIVPGFIWGAKLKILFKTWMRISDGYVAGVGIEKVDFLSIFPLISESNIATLNSAALHRFLAEAVWYPTAFLPGSGVKWAPINDSSSLATITHNDLSVSLEFHFNDENEVTRIYTNSRYQKINGKYCATAWEAHVSKYVQQSGLCIPSYGEVGWYRDGEWQCVLKANITNMKFNFYSNH